MSGFILDRSMYQERPIDSARGQYQVMLDVPAVRAHGCVGIIHRAAEGLYADPTFVEATSRSIAAGHPWGAYQVFRSDRSVSDQLTVMYDQLHRLPAGWMPSLRLWADVEEGSELGGASFYQKLLGYLAGLDTLTALSAGIYSRANYLDAHFTDTQQLAFSRRLGWWANSQIPVGWKRERQTWSLIQRLKAEHVAGVYNIVDVDDINPQFPLIGGPAMPPLQRVTGALFGGHTQGFSSITPIFRELRAQGIEIPIGISDEDGGKMSEWRALGVRTRINRKHLPEEGPDHEFELGGDFEYRKHWPADKRLRYQTAAVNLPYRASVQEFLDTTHFQTLGNEWENQDAEGWISDLDLYQGVLEQASQRSVHDKAVLMGISDEVAATLPPVRYVLPTSNAGTPKTWRMYEAIAAHSIWPIAARRGDIIWGHEGIAFDQPFEYGENEPVEPGAPMVPGTGRVNFRIFNLLWLLQARGVFLNWGVGEWYDGRRGRGEQVLERVHNMIRHDLLLSASPFSATCLGYCQFQFDDNPTSKWREQDCTLLWQHPAWQAHLRNQIGRINGATHMTDIKQADLDKLFANTQAQLAASQANLAILSTYAGKHVPAGNNQDVINLFSDVFGNLEYGAKLVAAGLSFTYTPQSNRSHPYPGPAVEDMTLNAIDKAALLARLPR